MWPFLCGQTYPARCEGADLVRTEVRSRDHAVGTCRGAAVLEFTGPGRPRARTSAGANTSAHACVVGLPPSTRIDFASYLPGAAPRRARTRPSQSWRPHDDTCKICARLFAGWDLQCGGVDERRRDEHAGRRRATDRARPRPRVARRPARSATLRRRRPARGPCRPRARRRPERSSPRCCARGSRSGCPRPAAGR